MENGNGKLIGFIQQNTQWILAVIIIPVMFFMGNAIVANDRLRAEEDKALACEIKQEDDQTRRDFLLAIKDIYSENKKDMEKVSDKMEKLSTAIAELKIEIKKK